MSREDVDIKIKFWGTRGSIPTPGRYAVRYGGNTSCVEIRCGETILIFDAGSGIRELGASLLQEFAGKDATFNILISHTHWDHIQGFPFFSVAYLPSTQIDFFGGNSVTELKKLIFEQMNPEYFPVSLFELASTINFHTLRDSPFHINDVKIHFTHLIHPALSLGFRIEYKGKTVVYATDCEISTDPDVEKMTNATIESLFQGADVLIADCQYTANEYETKTGWGHSSIEKMSEVAVKHGVKHLFAFHHDPMHTDDDIDIMVANAQELAGSAIKIYGAKEKSTIYL